ncbi:MAG TPA: aldehyde dehydrogenase, partial [Candidatus Izemoplasmatales bacterium]|nr:aldehyde dehydrogenase [Candidatus Izemoplasmatales bacterium]
METKRLVSKQRNFYLSNKTQSHAFRMNALKKLYRTVQTHEDAIKEALKKDLHKSGGESYLTEIGVTLKEIRYLMKHLKKFMKTKRQKTELSNFPAKSFISPHPYGVSLIMSPWNYPIYLTLAPLAGAIAAGNTAVVKPSNYSQASSDIIEKMLEDSFNDEYIAVVKGGREENQDLLNQHFDYIFFTGSPTVGKIVMEKASKHLTPISLELGGKSPTIVSKDADIDLSAKRIIFGKLINVGQTCVAPDYILAHASVHDQLIESLKKYIVEFYTDDPLNHPDYGKIINQKHFNRLKGLIEGENIVFGGKFNQKTHQIEPTILDHVKDDSPVMQEEIFGPILPILTYETNDEAINFVRNRPHPLAFYLFTNSKNTIHAFLNQCQFGGGCINDTIMQVASDYLPFGGVGN